MALGSSRSEAGFIASFPNLEDRHVVNPPHPHSPGHRLNPFISRQKGNKRRGPEAVGISQMLLPRRHNGAGPPAQGVWGWQEAGITAVTARDDPGVGAKVWRKTNSRKREEPEEEVLPFPTTSCLLALGSRYCSTARKAKPLIHTVERNEPGGQTGSQPPP